MCAERWRLCAEVTAAFDPQADSKCGTYKGYDSFRGLISRAVAPSTSQAGETCAAVMATEGVWWESEGVERRVQTWAAFPEIVSRTDPGRSELIYR